MREILYGIETKDKLIEKIINMINQNTDHFQMIKKEIRRHEILKDPQFMKMSRVNSIPITNENKSSYNQSNTINYIERASELGCVYSISTSSQSVAANGFLVFQLTNPANSGKTIYVNTLSGGATRATTIDIFKNATFAATGTALIPINRNWDSSSTSSITCKYLSQASDPTTGGFLLTSIIQTGGPLVLEFSGQFIIPSSTSNREIYIRLNNHEGSSSLISTDITWWEF